MHSIGQTIKKHTVQFAYYAKPRSVSRNLNSSCPATTLLPSSTNNSSITPAPGDGTGIDVYKAKSSDFFCIFTWREVRTCAICVCVCTLFNNIMHIMLAFTLAYVAAT